MAADSIVTSTTVNSIIAVVGFYDVISSITIDDVIIISTVNCLSSIMLIKG